MEPWGAMNFGDPCGECGFEWSLAPEEGLAWMADLESHIRSAAGVALGCERLDGWSVSEYVSHVGDNLRQWAERVQAVRLTHIAAVGGYDPDALAAARGYEQLALPAAIWSAIRSADAWSQVLRDALAEGVELHHATRGLQRAEDIVRNNTHDAYHHVWDIQRIVSVAH